MAESSAVSEIQRLGRELHENWKQQRGDIRQMQARLDEHIDEVNVRVAKLKASGGPGGPSQRGSASEREMPSGLLRTGEDFLHGLRRAHAETGTDLDSPFSDAELAEIRPGALLLGMAFGNHKLIQSNLNELEISALRTATGAEGGWLVDEAVSSRFIDAARPASRVLAAGASVLPMEASTVHLPGWADPITARWVGELQERAETDSDFRKVTLAAKTVATRIKLSLELLEDSGTFEPVTEIVMDEFARAIGGAIDLAALVGTGTDNQPLGIYYADGVNEETLGAGSGATPSDYDFLLDAMYEIEEANFTPNAVLWSARTANTLRKLKTGLSGDKTQLSMPAEVQALKRLTTNQIPNDLQVGAGAFSAAIVGQFDQLVIGARPSLALQTLTDPYTASSTGAVWLNARVRADVAMLNRKAFTRVRGIDD